MKGLSDKKYFAIKELEGLDFVLMFLPVEPAFSLLFQEDQPLYLEALDKNIVIVSPSTLLATLRTVHSIWSQEMQSRNALDIAQRAGALYDKFVGFIGDLTKVSDHLDKAQKSHEAALNKLSTGRGNLLGQVEKLKDLGAKTTKALPSQLVDKATSTPNLEEATKPTLETDDNE
jgi:DNA recombination protein RmuC